MFSKQLASLHSTDCAHRTHSQTTDARRILHASIPTAQRQARKETACTTRSGRKKDVAARAVAEPLTSVKEPTSSTSQPTAFDELSAGTARKYVMISGKGGVGKTSLAASLAVKFAAEGHNTLVVSTDPAHSLSDSLGQNVGGGGPVAVEGTALPLWGMEIDPEKAKDTFKASVGKNDGKGAKDLLKQLGLGMITNQLADLKLGELLDTPPPGLDEAVAIAKVVEFVRGEEYARFTRIVFDTAPTGHTLRLLAVPQFVDASLGKIIRLRKKLSSAGTAIRGLFGVSEQQDEAVQKLENLRDSVNMVGELFRNAEATEFIIATIPTVLGINESRRLLAALRKDAIPCRRIIVNQVIGDSQGAPFLRMKLKDQQRALDMLSSDAELAGLQQLRGPLLDLEVRGVPALSYFGRVVWGDALDTMASGADRQYVMLGGKGGVGKTSSAASLAVALAGRGLPTLVVSTDPAHSLSDSLDQDVSGGEPVSVGADDLPLWGMEVDVEAAAAEIRGLGKEDGGGKVDGFLSSLGMGAFAEQLKDLRLSELLETLPPGVDEAVAVSKVVAFLKDPKYAHFQRIIFDTAPTGHTLRLLTLPDFLDATLGKVVRLRQKLTDAADSVTGLLGVKKQRDNAVARLESLQERMEEARAVFRNEATTQFVVVTIPTVMAAAESSRLVKALRTEHVPVRTLLVNQVVEESAGDRFLAQRRKDQQRALATVRSDPTLGSLQLIEAPLVDLEVRGVPALQYFGGNVWKSSKDSH